jgi:Secretion system C-terminal sorting domain
MKINLLLFAIALSIIIYAGSNESDGIVSLTLRDGGTGCLCHNLEPNDSVHVWIEGLDSVFVSDTVEYKIFMTGGPAVLGGFDMAVFYGMLEPADTLTHIEFGELTHSFPNPFVNDTVFWSFKYFAPDTSVIDTIYSVANSVNGDGLPFPQVDQWNFSENFPVKINDIPVSVENESLPFQFQLSQNYPNPFNPGTSIQYTVSNQQFVSLNVYDILGNEVATLVNEEKSAGSYEVIFDGTKLTSGVYIYTFQTGEFVSTKKMILLK